MGSKLAFDTKTMFLTGYDGMKKGSRIHFVDGDQGSDQGDGNKPERAFQTVQKVIATMNSFDVAYIMERNPFNTSEPTPYVPAGANLTIASTKPSIKLVGCPIAMEVPWTVQIKGCAALTTHLITVNANSVRFENLSFNKAATVDASGLLLGDVNGTSIYNCDFKNFRGAAGANAEGGAVRIVGGWNNSVTKSYFRDCRCGIQMNSGVSTTKWTRIVGCDFLGTPASRDADIYMMAGGVYYITTIKDCTFGPLPAYATAVDRYFNLLADGSITNCFFGCNKDTTFTTNGTGGYLAATFFYAGLHVQEEIAAKS